MYSCHTGYVVLQRGDYVFARNMWGSGLPEDDVIQAYVTPEYVLFLFYITNYNSCSHVEAY